MIEYGGFRKWILKSPWVSILSHGLMIWMIWGIATLGNLHVSKIQLPTFNLRNWKHLETSSDIS